MKPTVTEQDIDAAFSVTPREESKDIVPAEKANVPIVGGKYRPDSLDAVWRLSGVYIRAGMVPNSLQGRTPHETQARICIAIESGMSAGLTVSESLQWVMVVNGRACLWGDAPLALVRRSRLCVGVHEELAGLDKAGSVTPDTVAVCTVRRIAHDGSIEEVRRTFSAADAKNAGLSGKRGPWESYPKRMLQLRARAFALRDSFPDAIMGFGIAEEHEEFGDSRKADAEARIKHISGHVSDPVLPTKEEQ